jgi:hypothetical protein
MRAVGAPCVRAPSMQACVRLCPSRGGAFGDAPPACQIRTSSAGGQNHLCSRPHRAGRCHQCVPRPPRPGPQLHAGDPTDAADHRYALERRERHFAAITPKRPPRISLRFRKSRGCRTTDERLVVRHKLGRSRCCGPLGFEYGWSGVPVRPPSSLPRSSLMGHHVVRPEHGHLVAGPADAGVTFAITRVPRRRSRALGSRLCFACLYSGGWCWSRRSSLAVTRCTTRSR